MSTEIKPELSRRNPYYIEKYRFLELKAFCMQYPIWIKARSSIDGYSASAENMERLSRTNNIQNPTERCVEAMLYYTHRIDMIETAAKRTDEALAPYLIKAVTNGRSYDWLQVNTSIPYSRGEYYHLYRRFFWILNKLRE